MGIKILGTGSYVPEQTLRNDDISKFLDTNDEWITSRTGISERRISGWEPTWYIGVEASKRAIVASGIDPAEIGLVIDTTITSDFHTPSVASIIQDEVGAKDAAAFDLNAACTGFVYALETARRFLETDDGLKYALVVASENLSRITNYEDRSSCILFGDGAAAAVIEKSDSLFSAYLGSDGSGSRAIYARSVYPAERFRIVNGFEDGYTNKRKHQLTQDGQKVYRFAVSALPKAFKIAADKIGITAEDIDWFVPHQANLRIIETAAKHLGVSLDKFILTLDHYGNTSSASIPMALDEGITKGMIKRGQKLALIGFGAGLSYGAAIFEY